MIPSLRSLLLAVVLACGTAFADVTPAVTPAEAGAQPRSETAAAESTRQ